jgi:hemoglobin-like flavoprotein
MAPDGPFLRDHFELVLQRDVEFPARFYEILFARHPAVRSLFARNSDGAQHSLLAQTLMAVLDHIEEPQWLGDRLSALGEQHLRYGVTPEMYDWVGDALIAAIAEATADVWSPRHQAEWTSAYQLMVAFMCPAGSAPEAKTSGDEQKRNPV